MKKSAPQRIGITLHKHSELIHQTLQDVLHFLEPLAHELTLCPMAKKAVTHNHPALAPEALAAQSDLLIVIGGDGSMLATAKYASKTQTPMVGVNCGKKGFLADVAPKALTQLSDILAGEYVEEERLLLTLPHMRQHALNDIVIRHAGPNHQMLHFELFIDDHFVCHQQSDGLIIATPTGSTAYALSAGGSILHPSLAAITLVPICAHRLNTRPIVIPAYSRVRLNLLNPTAHFSLTADGRPLELSQAPLCVELAADRVRLRHPKTYNYYDTLTQKLHWESGSVDA